MYHKLLIPVVCFGLLLLEIATAAEAKRELSTTTNVPVEIEFQAQRDYKDPFNEVTLNAGFTQPDGTVLRVPGFWAGGKTWKVRYASAQVGTHTWRSECGVLQGDAGLHAVQGKVEIAAYHGDNPLFTHGPIRVATDKRNFEHADGTPFFWLGDTWWMGLCHRLHWPDEFQQLTADRKQKGFTVVQIVAGLYPDMHPFDPRGANEAGYPWEKDYSSIRPQYFDAADARLRHLVDQGIAPCIVGGWGYFLPWMGVEKMNAHWRYLIAHYGAWPVVWCAGGEANLPWYLVKNFPYDDREQVHSWTEVLRFIRQTDPWRRPLTIHPTAIKIYTSRHATDDPALLDFDMLQTPHGRGEAAPITVQAMRDSYIAKPTMPVVDGEAAYEKLGDNLPTEWTRAMFWLCMTNGACGHTYGANGIWQCNRRGQPHGASPHGPAIGYGVIAWDEAMHFPGSTQMAIGKKFFESLPWTKLVPFPDSVDWADMPALPRMSDWIWFPEGDPKRDAPAGGRVFRRVFDLPDPTTIRGAMLHATADDYCSAWINGQRAGSASSSKVPTNLNVAKFLKPGQNVLAIRVENVPTRAPANPAGLNAVLAIQLYDGKQVTIRTDDSWLAAKSNSVSDPVAWNTLGYDDSAWQAALVTAKLGDGPWGEVAKPAFPYLPQACGIDDRLRVVYVLPFSGIVVHGLHPQGKYRLTLFDPVTGNREATEEIAVDQKGDCVVSSPKHDHDWVVLLEAL